MSNNANLCNAQRAKNDEFYTMIEDIEKELSHYISHFKDKVVYCNCDDPEWSNFWKYFHMNFAALGLKKLISTHYNPGGSSYIKTYEGGADDDISVGTITPLESNGDFRSDECIEILKSCDIVVTNPPFSLFREYVAQLMEYDKKFLIIGNQNAIIYKEIFTCIKNDKMRLGIEIPKKFNTPDGYTNTMLGFTRWFTNIKTTIEYKRLILTKKYNPEEYPKYDNYDAINVNKTKDIPCDYDGVMGVPISFFDKYNPEQFEILGQSAGRYEFHPDAYPTKRYENAIQHNKDGSTTSGSKVNTGPCIVVNNPVGVYYTADNSPDKLERLYARILIRRK